MAYVPSLFQITVQYAGQDYVIPWGSSVTPDTFQILNPSDGSSETVQPIVAASLYAASEAYTLLNSLVTTAGIGSSQTYWENVFGSVTQILKNQEFTDFAADASGSVLGSLLDPSASPDGFVDAFANLAKGLSGDLINLAGAGVVLGNAITGLDTALTAYQQIAPDVFGDHAGVICFDTIESTINSLLSSWAGGNAATTAVEQLGNLNDSWWDEVKDYVSDAFSALADTVAPEVTGILKAAYSTVSELSSATTFVTTVVNEGEFIDDLYQAFNTVNDFGPLTQKGLGSLEATLAYESYVIQAQQGGGGAQVNPQPVVTAKSTDYTLVNTNLALHLLFTSAQTPAVEYFNIVNSLQGPGEIVVNNVVHTGPDISDVSSADFSTAYFTAASPGTDQITVVAVDDSGDYSEPATTTITVGGQLSPPATTSQADLKVSTASLISSNLTPGGGGIVAYTVINAGTVAAPTTSLSRIYLSSAPTLTSSAILVSPGAISDPALAAGANQSDHLAFSLPENIAGSYYLIVSPDDDGAFPEATEGNNTYAIPITVVATGQSPSYSPLTSPQPSGPNPLSIVTNASITTRVGSEPAIESSALLTADSQYPNNSELLYTVVTPPADGRLIDNFFTTSTFAQADIDNGLVDYVQNGTTVSSDSFTFYVSDPAGYRTPVQAFTFNILPPLTSPPQAPAPPEVTVDLAEDTGPPFLGGPADDTSDDALTGTANPNATVVLVDGSTSLGSVVADSAGMWSYVPSELAQGGHYIQASVTNSSGQTATSYLSFLYDTIAPSAPSTPQLAESGSVADTAIPTFTGTAEANDQVVLLDGNTIIGTGTADTLGSWTVETSSLNLGYHSIAAEAIDAAGNVSSLSGADTVEIVPPPPGEIELNDAAMIEAGDLAAVGTVSDQAGSITEYGPITADGFTLTNTTRTGFSFITWTSGWAFVHGSVGEYYDGPDVLIVPSDGIVAAGEEYSPVSPATADTIDLSRPDGTAFSLVSIDIGPTGDFPTTATFTGTTASGQTITESVELNLPQNSGLQQVALTGFGDVTDVKIAGNLGQAGDTTSIELDNMILGNAIPPTFPPAVTSFTEPVTLDDAAMVAADQIPLISSDDNVFSQSTYYEYGSISADGFTISNLSRSDFSFSSYDSHFASVDGYFYDGPDILTVPVGLDITPSQIDIKASNGMDFGITSIQLDTTMPTDNRITNTVTFTGTAPSGSIVTEAFPLDNINGLQTFNFSNNFDNLSTLSFVGSSTVGLSNIQFDAIVLSPPVPATPSGLSLSPASDSGAPDAQATNVTTPAITGTGEAGDTVTLYDDATPVGSGSVENDGSWSTVTNALPGGLDALTAVEVDSSGDISDVSAPLSLTIDTTPPSVISNGPIIVGLGSTETITSDVLSAVDDFSTPEQESYTIITPPIDGVVLKDGSPTNTFTQADINNGQITYQQNGGILAGDSWKFVVSDAAGNATVPEQVEIEVVDSGGTITSGGVTQVSSGGSIADSIILGGGVLILDPGGTASATTIASAAIQNVESGGTDFDAQVTGTQNVFGTASGGMIFSGGIANVSSGGMVIDDTVLSGGHLVALSGGDVDPTVISNGGLLQISAGGTADGTIVENGGEAVVEVGGVATETVVASGGVEAVFGMASGSVVSSTGGDYVQSGGSTNFTVLSGGGDEFVEVGGDASGTMVDGGNQVVYGAATSTVIDDGAYLYLEAGTTTGTVVNSGVELVVGIASGTTDNSGGFDFVLSGGSVVSTTLDGGEEYIEIGATASATVVNSAGAQVVYGAIDDTTLNSDTSAYLEPGSVAGGVLVNGGLAVIYGDVSAVTVTGSGYDYVEVGGSTFGTVLSAGDEYVESGASTSSTVIDNGNQVIYGTTTATVINGGSFEYLYSGGTASGTVVNSGIESIFDLAIGTIVNSGGYDYINDGSASGTVVEGGDELVEFATSAVGTLVSGAGGGQFVYGTALSATLISGGEQVVEIGGVANATIADSGGEQDVESGGVTGDTIVQGGREWISAGGIASGTVLLGGRGDVVYGSSVATTISGGGEFVESGGSATGATVYSGAQAVEVGGSAVDTLVSGGTQYVYSGGTASGTTVDSAGEQYVEAGGVVAGAMISGGTVELTSGSITNGDVIGFAIGGGGTLKLDDTVDFSGTVAGFGLPDSIDLADIAFSQGTSLGFAEAGNNLSGTLSVNDGTHAANLTLLGQYVAGQFHLAPDGNGGTLLTDPPLMANANPASYLPAAASSA